MKLTERDVLCYEAIRAKLSPSPFPFPPMGDVSALVDFSQQEITYYNEQLDLVESHLNLQCTCYRGCKGCCYQLVIIMECEVPVLRGYLSQWSQGDLRALAERTSHLCNILYQRGYPEDGFLIGERMYGILIEDFPKVGLPCPLLTQDGACSVHPIRPSLCWMYRNYSIDQPCGMGSGSISALNYDAFSNQAALRLARAQGIPVGRKQILPMAVHGILKEIL